MECGECTLCCELLPVPWMNSPAGHLCNECDEGQGCKIYNIAPKKCLEFCCAYNQMKKVSINFRPDKCGVIFEKITDDIFIGTVDPNESKLKDIVKGQINSFLGEGFSVVLFNQKIKNPLIYHEKNTTADEVFKSVNMEAIKRGSRNL